MPLLFSYGTLQREDIQRSVFGRFVPGQPDELPCYERGLVEHDSETHAIVTFNARPQSRVLGVVLEISDEELARADGYEPEQYKRIAATLLSGKEAWVYVDARADRP